MELFHIIEDGAVILRVKGGVFKQAKVFRRDGDVFAGVGGSSFIRLVRGGGTSDPRTTWLDVEGPGVSVATGIPKWTQPPAAKAKGKLAVVSA